MNKPIRLITRKWLERHDACEKGLDFFDTVIFGDALPECDIDTVLKGLPEHHDWIDWLNSRLDRYGHELKTIKIGDTIQARHSELDITAGHEYKVTKGPAVSGLGGLCFVDEVGDKRLLRFRRFSIPEKTKEAAPIVELWAVSPGVEIPKNVLGYGLKSSDPTLLRVTVDANGKRTLNCSFVFGAGDVFWHMPNDHVHLVGINCREALEPYLPQVTKLTRAEIAKKLGIENLEIVD